METNHILYRIWPNIIIHHIEDERFGNPIFPNFVSQYFPRRDDPKTYELYCASLLVRLRPWRDLRADLKDEDQLWSEVYQNFLESALQQVHRVVSGIQYFHECDTAQAAKEADRDRTHDCLPNFADAAEDEDDVMAQAGQQDDSLESQADTFDARGEVTEEELVECLASQIPIRERRHAEHAIAAAEEAGFFSSETRSWIIGLQKQA
ncbi:hypothetical protein BJV78DRAFT_1205758 [Lactifluus subvellereus]|nr:hypothetical protein BJV78DRAFT_1205758 [Lactifluus subvellereus]